MASGYFSSDIQSSKEAVTAEAFLHKELEKVKYLEEDINNVNKPFKRPYKLPAHDWRSSLRLLLQLKSNDVQF